MGISFRKPSLNPEKIYVAGENSSNGYNKVIVFDMDETIGQFNELIELLRSIKIINSTNNVAFPIDEQTFFNELLDIYPEFIRKGMMHIFEFVRYKKKMNECFKVYMYTNNIYSPILPKNIAKYIDYKLNTTGFFDKIICAFKINGVIIEPLRTTNKKTYSDFINCTMLPKSTEICYIDDSYYENMKNKKIYYIRPYLYYHGITKETIIHRFINSQLFHKYTIHLSGGEIINIKDVLLDLFSHIKNSNKTSEDYKNDTIVSQKISYYVKEFFYMTTRRLKTKKNNRILSRFTRKK
jgi:hypothetical protein